METEEDMLTGFNLNDTPSTFVIDANDTSRYKPDGDALSEPETEYLDFSNVSSMAMITEQSLDERNYQILNGSEAFLSSTEMSEVYTIRRKMFNVRIKAKIAPECNISGQATKNGIRISISPRKALTSSESGGGISVKSDFRQTVMKELSQSAANKKVLHYLESLSTPKQKSRKSLEKEFLHNKEIPRRRSDVIPRNIEKPASIKPRKSSPLPQKRPLSPPSEETTDMNFNKIRRSSSSEYEDCYEEIHSSRATEGSTEWTTDDIQSELPKSPVKDTQPMIRITQEMSAEMVVTSRVDINKDKVRKMQAKRKASRQIISDNFCNEILDQTINCMKSPLLTVQSEPLVPEPVEPIEPPPEKPPRTFAFNTSNSSSLGSLDSSIYEELKQLNLFEFHNRTLPKSSPQYEEPEYGYTPPEKDTPEAVQIGWSPQVLTMLQYSDDERREKLRQMGTKAEPQVGPKLDIDTVDSKIRGSSSNSTQTSRISDNLSRKFKRTKEICKRFLDGERRFYHPKKKKMDKPEEPPLPSVDDFLREEISQSCRSIQSPRRPRSCYVTPEKGGASFANTPSTNHSDRIDRSAETVRASDKYMNRRFNSNAPLPQSPRKRFSFTTPKRFFHKTPAKDVTSYRSFGEPELAATMSEILKQLREVIEPDRSAQQKQSPPQTVPKAPPRRNRKRQKQQLKRSKSMSSDYIAREQIVQIDLHNEPSYDEVLDISRVSESKSAEPTPKKWHTIKGVPHVILNDDPNAIYATVRKHTKNSRSTEVLPTEGSAARRRISFHDSKPKRPLPDVDQIERFIYEERRTSIADEEVEAKRTKVQEYYQRKTSSESNGDAKSESGAYQSFASLEQDLTLKVAKVVGQTQEEDVRSIHINYESSGSDEHNNEAVYAVVDYEKKKKAKECVAENVDDDTISEFDTFFNNINASRQVTSLDGSFSTTSALEQSFQSTPAKTPKSDNKNQLYRSLTHTLRRSFRKGRTLMQNERLATFFDRKVTDPIPKPARSFYHLDDYKTHYNDINAEKVFQKWVSRDRLNGFRSAHEREMHALVEQIARQRQIKTQLQNALTICRNSKEFDSSNELVEAERLLLVSNLKEAIAKKFLAQLDASGETPKIDAANTGAITLNDFEFPLKESTVRDALNNHFFVCVCTYKTQIEATFAKECTASKIRFSSVEIKFWEVDADYQVRVEVFSLSIKKNSHSVESRFQSIKNIVKQSPKRFFNSAPPSPKAPVLMQSSFSGFKSQGFFHINSDSFRPHSSSNFQQDLRHAGDHFVQTMEDFLCFDFKPLVYNSHLQGSMLMGLKSDIIFNQMGTQGFLNVAVTNVYGAWNRRWCKLNGFALEFWNYPQDVTEKEPIEIIDLRKCLCDYIQVAAREVCPKKNCMEIPIEDSSNDSNSQIYFLVADNMEKLQQWMEQINQTLKFIEDWNIMQQI